MKMTLLEQHFPTIVMITHKRFIDNMSYVVSQLHNLAMNATFTVTQTLITSPVSKFWTRSKLIEVVFYFDNYVHQTLVNKCERKKMFQHNSAIFILKKTKISCTLLCYLSLFAVNQNLFCRTIIYIKLNLYRFLDCYSWIWMQSTTESIWCRA